MRGECGLRQKRNESGIRDMNRGARLSTRITAGLVAAFFLVLLWPNAGAFAQLSTTPREETWVTNGGVNAIVTTPTTTYIGGEFTYVGPCTGSFVPIDAGTGAAVGVFRAGSAADTGAADAAMRRARTGRARRSGGVIGNRSP